MSELPPFETTGPWEVRFINQFGEEYAFTRCNSEADAAMVKNWLLVNGEEFTAEGVLVRPTEVFIAQTE